MYALVFRVHKTLRELDHHLKQSTAQFGPVGDCELVQSNAREPVKVERM